MAYGDSSGTWVLDPWSGEQVWIPNNLPNNTKKQSATGFDWLNAILTGATNILGQLFPGGLNNSGANTYPGQYPGGNGGGGGGDSNNNLLLYVVIGFAALYFLTKDSK